MINSQYARVGKIFPSSGIMEPSTTFTPTSGQNYNLDHLKSDDTSKSSQIMRAIK